METLLNLVWLGVAATLLVVWGTHVARARQIRSRSLAAIALVCVICLLFPVISMTDDLNSGNLAFLEPSKAKRLLASVHLAAIVLPWLCLQIPVQTNWIALRRQPNDRRPPRLELVSYSLSRRPPPSRFQS